MNVIFILRIFKILFGHLCLRLKFEYDPTSGRWDIPLLIFWGCWDHLHFKYLKIWWSKIKFNIWVWSNKWLLIYSTFNILRTTSIGGHLCFNNFQNLVWSYKHKFKIWEWSIKWLLIYISLLIFWGCLLWLVIFHLRLSSF